MLVLSVALSHLSCFEAFHSLAASFHLHPLEGTPLHCVNSDPFKVRLPIRLPSGFKVH